MDPDPKAWKNSWCCTVVTLQKSPNHSPQQGHGFEWPQDNSGPRCSFTSPHTASVVTLSSPVMATSAKTQEHSRDKEDVCAVGISRCIWDTTFALNLHFLLNASAVQLSMRFPNSSPRDTESMNLACNQIFLFPTNLLPSTSRKQWTAGRHFLIKTHYRQHIDHLYISGCVHDLFYIISNSRCSFHKATLIISLKSLLSIDYGTK